MYRSLPALCKDVSRCTKCPRLVKYRRSVALNPPKRFQGQRYWARPVCGFGDPEAEILVVGLAPAANGGNRTGRVFTGDRSGDFLFNALFEVGLANQPLSTHKDDGLALKHVYVTASVRCAPPDNKPLPKERENCRPYLIAEMKLLKKVKVIVALGQYGWQSYLQARKAAGLVMPPKLPTFGHGAISQLPDRLFLLGTYHPSQQNTFTGRLTPKMLQDVLIKAKELAEVTA